MVTFDSVMLSENDLLLQNYGFRLLEVNNRLKMMYLVNTCFLVTSKAASALSTTCLAIASFLSSS